MQRSCIISKNSPSDSFVIKYTLLQLKSTDKSHDAMLFLYIVSTYRLQVTLITIKERLYLAVYKHINICNDIQACDTTGTYRCKQKNG